MGIKINKELLEREIDSDIKELETKCWTDSAFAFYEKNGVQVQIHIIADGDDFFDDVIENLAE